MLKSALKKVSLAAAAVTAASLVLLGCLPEPLEVKDIPAVKPEIVVSSQIVPDETVLILLTRSIGALDASNDSDPEELIEQIAVNDATVTIEDEEGNIYALNFLENGLYGQTFIPFETGATYKLNVVSESLGEVTAETTVQAAVTFQTVEASLYYNGFGDTLAQIDYSIQDLPGINRYLLNVQEVEQEDAVANLINPRAFTRLVTDDEFDGQAYSESFRVFPRDYEPGDTIAVSIANISEEYFNFMQLRIDNRFSFVEFLGEPVNYPTNVKGGKGFFNLYIPDFRVFVLEEQ